MMCIRICIETQYLLFNNKIPGKNEQMQYFIWFSKVHPEISIVSATKCPLLEQETQYKDSGIQWHSKSNLCLNDIQCEPATVFNDNLQSWTALADENWLNKTRARRIPCRNLQANFTAQYVIVRFWKLLCVPASFHQPSPLFRFRIILSIKVIYDAWKPYIM